VKTHNVGILGFGFIGKVHAYAYSNLPFYYDPPPLDAKVTHVVTSRAETAEKARRTIGAQVAATDYRAVTENPEVDLVHICTPNHLHKDALLSAMRHGKHVYCDKPLVATMAEAEEVRAALGEYRGTAQMTFHLRFFPATLRAKQLIDEGALGQILGFRAAFLHGGSADPNAPLKWKLTAAAGQRYDRPATTFPSPKAAVGWLRAHVGCLANFLQAVAEGRPAEPGLEQGIRVQHLMDRVRRSAGEGRWVDV